MEKLIVTTIVLLAGLFLARQFYRYLRASRTQGGCPSCGSCKNSVISPSGEGKRS